MSRSVPATIHRRRLSAFVAALSLTGMILPSALGVQEIGSSPAASDLAAAAGGHLLVSEIVTGGGSASDEFVELYNPASISLPTEGLELIYVTASGATVTRKAVWAAGAPEIAPGGHLLIANEAGLYAAVADITYANGLAATGGSIALRIVGASSAIDAVGWGTAANAWLEGTPAAAATAGHSIERLPGGAQGSTQDTNQNAIDFVERESPDPQNAGSPPVPSGMPSPDPSADETPSPTTLPSPGATPTPPPDPTPTPPPDPTPTPSADVTPEPTLDPTPDASPTPTPTPTVLAVADARALPDGSQATIEAVSLTDGSFGDGGGYVADDTGGIAILLSDGTFPTGVLLRATGTLDDRYHQRTLRATTADITVLGAASDPIPVAAATGSIGEPLECRLVAVAGDIVSAAAELSGGVAFDLNDGSGPVRVFVGDTTGIATDAWERGVRIELHGVVGQRDSTGTGSAGYRVHPRGVADILSVGPAPTDPPTPSPSPTPGTSPTPGVSQTPGASPSASPAPALISIATARSASSGQRVRVRGVVTLPSGMTEPGTAVVQDASAGILIRLADEAGSLARGELVELIGSRSTKSGMLSIRVNDAPLHLGHQPEPSPIRLGTGRLGEGYEAQLVAVRGAIAGNLQRTSAGNTYFELDDGSGPARVILSPRAGVAAGDLAPGAWIEVVGVLGQDTTSQQPTRGYRIWPRADSDVTVLARPMARERTAAGGAGATRGGSTVGRDPGRPGDLIEPAASGSPQLAVPQLARAIPTASAPQIVIGPTDGFEPEPETHSRSGAAGLLVGGLLLLGSAWLAATSGLAGRLRDAIMQPGRGYEGEVGGGAIPSADGVPDPTTGLVPLTVLDGGPADEVPQGAFPRKGGRILPPT